MFVSLIMLKKDNKFVGTEAIKINTTNGLFAHKKWNQYLDTKSKEGFDVSSNILIDVDKAKEIHFSEEELEQSIMIENKYFNK